MSDDFQGTKHDAKKKSKKAATSSSEDSGPDDIAPVRPPKKAKIETVTEKPKKKGNQKNEAEAEASFPLSKNKFVKVRSYHGQVLIDIREFYMTADGELRPGKKGIALNPVQWEQLKGIMADVDAAIVERI